MTKLTKDQLAAIHGRNRDMARMIARPTTTPDIGVQFGDQSFFGTRDMEEARKKADRINRMTMGGTSFTIDGRKITIKDLAEA